MLTRIEKVRLNRLAQSLEGMGSGETWFRSCSSEKSRELLWALGSYVQQSGAVPADLGTAIEKAKLKATHTPCVLLSKGPLKIQLAKGLALPASEHVKVFRLLVALLGIADGRRRREKCSGGCDHWWHNLDGLDS